MNNKERYRSGRPVEPDTPTRMPARYTLPASVMKRLKERAIKEDRTMSRVVERAIELYLKTSDGN
jgi:hypothetical protein